MTQFSIGQSGAEPRTRGHSMGVKLMLLCTIALLMTIPTLFVGGLVRERTNRADQVAREVSGRAGGPQTFLGPTLAIPYSIPPRTPNVSAQHGTYIVFPVSGTAAVRTATEYRRRSLFRVPVFTADLKMDATFDLTGAPALAPAGAQLDWSRAEIIAGASDPRGALADGQLAAGGKSVTLVPTQIAHGFEIGRGPNGPLKFGISGAGIGQIAKPGAQFSAAVTLRFSGAERIALLAYGKTTRVEMQGNWPDPGFDGGFLPVSRTVGGNGFKAAWSVPFVARGVPAEGPAEEINGLDATASGTSFIEVADAYQAVERSLKYVLLFVGMLFLSYFVFEMTTGQRVHPAQYVLVGVAQIIFYLLLLSLAERIGFDAGFLAAGSATVVLLSVNACWVFGSRLQGIRALVIFTLLYGVIYMLLTLEDNALLTGATVSFLLLAAAMYLSRNIDWYGLAGRTPETAAMPPAQPGEAS